MRACADMLIVASPVHAAAIDQSEAGASFPGLVVHPLSNSDPVPEALIAKAQVVVVEVDPAEPRSLDRLKALCRTHPGLPKIAAIRDATVSLARTLVREGVNDVVSLPFQTEELLDVALSALAAAKSRSGAQVRLAPQIAIVRSVGACGATTFAVQLAADLAQDATSARPMAIIDLDLQTGSVADYLGATGSGTVSDLLSAGDRLDEELLRSVARGEDENLAVFACPAEIQPIEAVDTDRLLQLLTLMRQNYHAVVVDLPSDWTNWALSVVGASDLIVMVVELTVNSLRQAKRRLELLETVGIPSERVTLVVNRVEKRLFRSIDLSDVNDTLQREVLGTLTLEDQDLPSAQAQGLLVQQLVRKSKYAADIDKLAELVTGRLNLGAI